MIARSVVPRFRWAFIVWVLLLPSAPVAAASSGLVVQQIGDVSSSIAQAVGSAVTIVPLSRNLDPRTTPILLAPGKVFVTQDGGDVAGLRPFERQAIQQAYEAGQVILMPDANTNDIEALHRLVDDGVAPESTTDPVVLAYFLRKENNIPTARLVTYPNNDELVEDDLATSARSPRAPRLPRCRACSPISRAEDELATSRALEIVIAELTRKPSVPGAANSSDWGSSPVQSIVITSTKGGTYNMPLAVYALHSCQQNKDYYLVSTGGTWTPEIAQYRSASREAGQLRLDNDRSRLIVDWQLGSDQHCRGGIDIFLNADARICGYFNYPLTYTVDIVPPSGPRVVQVNAAPAGDQGQSTSYTSGFAFSIGGGVDVSGSGPGGGFQAGVTWDNSVTTTVPALAIEAGNKGNQGTFTRYRYCTVGSSPNCTSTIQMTGREGFCERFVVGRPQQGQTPNGRLSNISQTVNWQVDPATYGDTFDVTVTFTADLAQSVSHLWNDYFDEPLRKGPRGMCSQTGCSCTIGTETAQGGTATTSHTFKVPRPSRRCSP